MVRLNRESKTHGLVLDPSLGLDLLATLGLELWFHVLLALGFWFDSMESRLDAVYG